MNSTLKSWIASLPFIQSASQRGYFVLHVEVYRRADTGPLRAAIEKILTNEPGSEKDPFLAGQRYKLALYDRDLDAAGRPAAALSQKNSLAVGFPATWP